MPLKLIIQSDVPLEVGKVYTSLWDNQRVKRPQQRFKVVAISTREEWIKYVMAYGEERAWAEMYADLDPYFYEIETD